VSGTEQSSANPLRTFFEREDHREIDKWLHYLDVYHRHLERFRGRAPVVLEFGIFHGGSLQMWRDYFGPDAQIHGVDINPACRALAEPGTTIHIGDQADRGFLRRLAAEIGAPVDVLVEDGGHEFVQQIATFEELYPLMSEDGVFVIEDLHTSYWRMYGGDVGRRGTFVEYAKTLVDRLNAWHSESPTLQPDDFTRSTRSIHLYPSVAVLERGRVERPETRKTGTPFLRPEELVAAQQPHDVPAPTLGERTRVVRRRASSLARRTRRLVGRRGDHHARG
jgi:hypothetical protein